MANPAPYASTLAALGVLTVALLEAWKKVFSTLPRFHRKALCRWLDYEKPPPGSSTQLQSTLAAGQYGLFNREKPEGYDARKAYAQLLHLTTGSYDHGQRARTLWNVSRVFLLAGVNILIWGHVAVGLWGIWFR